MQEAAAAPAGLKVSPGVRQGWLGLRALRRCRRPRSSCWDCLRTCSPTRSLRSGAACCK